MTDILEENVEEENLELSVQIETSTKKKNWFVRYWKFILGLIVTIGLLTYLIITSEPDKIWITLSNSNYLLILAAFGCTALLFVIKTIRWKAILLQQGHNVNFLQAFNLILIGTFGSAITPAKAGDILRAFYLSKKKSEIKVGTSVFSVVFDRILDLGGIFLIVAFSPLVLLRFNSTIDWRIPVGIVGGFVLFILIVVFVFTKKITKPILNFVLKFISKMFKKKETKEKIDITTAEIIDDFYKGQKNYKAKNYLWLGFLSVLFWILLGLQGGLLLLAFDVAQIDYFTVIVTLCIAAIVSLTIPTTIAGVGVRDFVIMYVLGFLMSLPNEFAISLSLIQTFINVLLPGIIGAILLFVKPRKKQPAIAAPN
ncbi:MAG: flippase-like domain-containing protein [Asgard group archaeon]|nr:flippase-like domain-containing protein [Asgard group archaeon]